MSSAVERDNAGERTTVIVRRFDLWFSADCCGLTSMEDLVYFEVR